MSELTIIANIRAVPERIAFVRAELEKLIAPTRAEDGCIAYHMHQDNADPAHFVFYEIWASPDLLKAHANAPHMTAFLKDTKGALSEFTLAELTRIV